MAKPDERCCTKHVRSPCCCLKPESTCPGREGEPDRDRVMGWEDETRLTGVTEEVWETQTPFGASSASQVRFPGLDQIEAFCSGPK